MRMKNTRVSSLTKKRRKAQANKAGLTLEALEDRQLLTVSWASNTTEALESATAGGPTLQFAQADEGKVSKSSTTFSS